MAKRVLKARLRSIMAYAGARWRASAAAVLDEKRCGRTSGRSSQWEIEASLISCREPRSGVDRPARAQSAVFVVDRGSLPERAVASLAVVEDLDVVEDFDRSSTVGARDKQRTPASGAPRGCNGLMGADCLVLLGRRQPSASPIDLSRGADFADDLDWFVPQLEPHFCFGEIIGHRTTFRGLCLCNAVAGYQLQSQRCPPTPRHRRIDSRLVKPLRVGIRNHERVGSRELPTPATHQTRDAPFVAPCHQQEMRWTDRHEHLKSVACSAASRAKRHSARAAPSAALRPWVSSDLLSTWTDERPRSS